MALRVLLADESSTIKRVMQLALQDFAVEVKSVHAGVDVIEVARTFKPDIVFADVLLQKKNGYEVAQDLKGDTELKTIPVVLMWSSFMELDQAAYQRAQANAKLEKPFDIETLRKIVRDNVPKLKNDFLSDYLKFPSNMAAPLRDEEAQRKAEKPKVPDAPPPPPIEDDIGQGFEPADLSATKSRSDLPPPPPLESEDEDWVKQDISKFTLDLAPLQVGGEDASISFDIHHGSLDGEKHIDVTNAKTSTSLPLSNEPTFSTYGLRSPPPERAKAEEIAFPDFDQLQTAEAHLPVLPEVEFSPPALDDLTPNLEVEKQMSAEQLEKIIRSQSKEVIEQVVRKVVPELATQIIRDEIKRLMAEGSD